MTTSNVTEFANKYTAREFRKDIIEKAREIIRWARDEDDLNKLINMHYTVDSIDFETGRSNYLDFPLTDSKQ